MKILSFFKLLKRKVDKYDYCVTNPFEIPQNVTLVWIEDCEQKENKKGEL